jgi:hypothetical protein
MKLGWIAPLLALTVAACGGGGEDAESAGTSGVMPDCSDVWVDGETLPEDYEGCTDGDTIAAAVTIECDSGIGTFVTYDDRFHALLGDTVTEASTESDEYAKAYEDCFADS